MENPGKLAIRLVVTCIFLLISSWALLAELLRGCSPVNVRAVPLDDGWVLMREDGKILTKERYCNGDEYSGGLIRFERCVPGKPTQSVYLTPTGEIALVVNAENTGSFSEGLASIEGDDNLWGYMNDQGKIVIAPKFDAANPFSEGLAAVQVQDKWEYIDTRGRTVLTPHFRDWQIREIDGFKFGGAFVLLFDAKNDQYYKAIVNHSGRWLVKPTPGLVGELDDGLAPLWSGDPASLGFVNSSGQMVIPPQFTGTASITFQDGLGVVFAGRGESRRAGFIDKEGHWVIEATFEDAHHFCDGLAPVKVNGRWGFVDTRGQLVVPAQYEAADSFDGGIATVYIRDEKGITHQGWIDRTGKLLYESSLETKIIEFHH
ncbi:MAG TPA: WG repeat-containing protein [Candidatus Limnocylindrales bacterium]|nr:WG repeat-containing protein [Candidatus Limnocylindrales bacterium]